MVNATDISKTEKREVNLGTLRCQLSESQKLVFDQVWTHLLITGRPLPTRMLQRALGKAALTDVLQGVSGSALYEVNENGKQCLKLALLGTLLTGHGTFLFGVLTQLLQNVKQRFEVDEEIQDLQSAELYKDLVLNDESQQRMLPEVLNLGLVGPWPVRFLGIQADGKWAIQITDSIVDLYRADSVPKYLEELLLYGYRDQPWSEKERLQQVMSPSSFNLAEGLQLEEVAPVLPRNSGVVYRPLVSESRIAELKTLRNPNYDCSRLIALCTELSECSARGYVHATIMLTRAVVDHVPPVFDCKSFSEVSNNYPGDKSFKEAMGHLDLFGKKIAHLHLHTQIRKKHALPTMTQADFAAPLDLLLGEVVRILSQAHVSAGE